MQINRYTRQVMTQNAVSQTYDPGSIARAGQIAGTFGELSAQISTKMNETADALWVNEALINRKKAAIDSGYAQRNNFTDNPYGFASYMEKTYNDYDMEAVKTAPSETAKATYQAQAKEDNLSLYNQNKAWEFDARVKDYDRRYKNSAAVSANIAYARGANGDDFDPSLNMDMDALSIGAKDLYSDQQLLDMNEATKENNYDSYIQGLITRDPKKAINKMSKEYKQIPENATFEDAVGSVLDFEGGYVANDAGAGPTIYGINSEANPEEFQNIVSLVQQGKTAEAQKLTKAVYKKKYWDAINADKLQPQLAYVAMDTAVNMGTETAKDLLSKSGGDIYAFLDARRDRYRSIAENNPSKAENLKGWLNRVDALEARLKGGLISPERQIELTQAADVEFRKQGNEYRNNFNLKWDAIEKTSAAGIRIDDGVLADLETNARAFGLDDEVSRVQDFRKNQTTVYDFSKMSLAEQKSYIETKQKQIEDGQYGESSTYQAVIKVYDTKLKMIKTDPWAYYSQAKILDDPTPLPYGDGEAMSLALSRRRAGIELVKQKDGIDVPVLTNAESDALYDLFNSGDMTRTAATIGQYQDFLTPKERAQIAAGFKDKSGLMSAVMVQDDSQISEQILLGSKIDNSGYSKDRLVQDMYTKIEDAVLDPVVLGAYTDAVYAQYKYLSLQAGALQDKDVDDDRLDKSIKNVIGKIGSISIGGEDSKVILPKDMSENQLENILIDASEEDFKAAAGSYAFAGGEPISYEFLRNNSRVISMGDGRYGFIVNDLGYAYTKDGAPIEIDINKLQTTKNPKSMNKLRAKGYSGVLGSIS